MVEDFDLYRMLDDLEELFALRARNRGLRFACERTAAVPRYLRTDASKLRQILINLVSNGVKYTGVGEVELQVDYEEGRLAITVADTGVGILAEEMETLFDAFVQTSSSRISPEGTGLGLA